MAKSFDINSLKKYLSPQSGDDLNRFLESVPEHVGKVALTAAGIAWLAAAALGLLAMQQTQQVITLKAELEAKEALSPVVPVISEKPVSNDDMQAMTEKMKEAYPELDIRESRSNLTIRAGSTAQYSLFREAIGHAVTGGRGWKVSLETLCVGRECDRNHLSASLSANKISVEKPN